MVRRLARGGSPFLGLAANNLHRRREGRDLDARDLAYVSDSGAELEGGIDRALAMVLGGPELDVGLIDHEGRAEVFE